MSISYFFGNKKCKAPKGFILDTYYPNNMVVLHTNASRYGHCQYIDCTDIIESDNNFSIEQVILSRFS